MSSIKGLVGAALVGTVGLVTPLASASFHLWDVSEVYSNADGTVQYIEMVTTAGGQHVLGGHAFTSNGSVLVFAGNLPSNATANRSFIMATAAFADLPGAVQPDYIIPDGFINVGGDTLSLRTSPTGTVWDSLTFGEGALPVDGCLSMNRNLTTGDNSPTNFANATGSIDLCSVDCPSDTNGDGMVGVDDLLAVILDWGTAGAKNGGDVDGSGTVDSDDLVQVILDWGPC